MATSPAKRAPYLLLGVLVFVVLSQVVDLAVGAPEVGVRVAVMLVAAVGAVVTAVWIARRRRVAPEPPPSWHVSTDMSAEDPGAAGATSARG